MTIRMGTIRMGRPIMERDEAPFPDPTTGAHDNRRPPIPSAQVDAALKRIARLIGRQMAREAFEKRQAANDNDRGLSDETQPGGSVSPSNEN